jgi:RNA polymerase sigma-70 factor (ECF subfamily)
MIGDRFDAVLAGAARGEEPAFAELYRDLHPPLLRYLRAMSWDHAEDACSETWLELTRSLGGFVGPEPSFRSWVFTVARRKLIDRIRYEARRPSSGWDGPEHPGPSTRDIAEDVVEMDSTYRALALVQTLPRDQAEAVLLKVVAGLEYADVAQVMDRTTGAVRVLVHRGLRRLAAELGDRSETPGVTP